MYVGTYVPRKQCENLGLEINFLSPRNRSDNDLERDKFDAKLSASEDNVMIKRLCIFLPNILAN
jgi:hypothetical protein